MEHPELGNRLNEAIGLVNAGRRDEARAILFSLSQQFPDVEQVWMWLATASDDNEDKIQYLERVLRLNPRNDRALRAYRALAGTEPPAPLSTAEMPVQSSSTSHITRTLESWLIALLGIAALITVVLAVGAVLGTISQRNIPTPTLTPTPTPTTTPTFTVTYTPGGPTVTPLGYVEPLPEPWTPSATFTASNTYTPRPTLTPSQTVTPSFTPPDIISRTPVPTITPGGPTFTRRAPTLTPTVTPSRQSTVTPYFTPSLTTTPLPG